MARGRGLRCGWWRCWRGSSVPTRYIQIPAVEDGWWPLPFSDDGTLVLAQVLRVRQQLGSAFSSGPCRQVCPCSIYDLVDFLPIPKSSCQPAPSLHTTPINIFQLAQKNKSTDAVMAVCSFLLLPGLSIVLKRPEAGTQSHPGTGTKVQPI